MKFKNEDVCRVQLPLCGFHSVAVLNLGEEYIIPDIVRFSLSRVSLESSQNGGIGTETIQEWSLEVFTVLLQ